MGSISEDIHEGIFRFSVPDLSLSAEERSLFAFPANKEVKEERLRLYDARTDGNLVRGPEGLDVHGFTYINHRSALSDCDQWFTGQNIEEIYLPEVEELVCRITGAKRAVVNNVAFRRKLTEMQDDHGHVLMRGCVLDQEIGKLPRDVPLGKPCLIRLAGTSVLTRRQCMVKKQAVRWSQHALHISTIPSRA